MHYSFMGKMRIGSVNGRSMNRYYGTQNLQQYGCQTIINKLKEKSRDLNWNSS